MRSHWREIALCVLLAGCGSSEAPDPGRPETSTQAAPAVESNRAPVIESVRLEPREPALEQVIRPVVVARDPDGDRVVLGYRWFIDGKEIRRGEPSLALHDVRKGARIEVMVTASDGTLDSESARAEATVIDRVPQIAVIAISPKGPVTPGSPISVQAAGSDPDGDPLEIEYRWFVNGDEAEARGTVFDTEGLRKDDAVYAEVRATDGRNWSEPRRSDVVRIGSAPPEITSVPPGFRKDGVFHYAVTAEDPDGDRLLRYRLAKAPEGMVIDSVLGEISWRPGNAQIGVHPVEVVVRDSTGLETKQSFEVTVRAGEAPAPPASPEGKVR